MAAPPPPIPQEKRAITREVALTYRRVYRAAKAAGAVPRDYHQVATTEALDAYMRLDPDAPMDRLEASRTAWLMITNAINADTNWYWHGPAA